MGENLDQRLTELEVRFSFIEQTLQALDSSVGAHERYFFEMRATLERLRVELMQLRTALSHDAHEEPPPPHY